MINNLGFVPYKDIDQDFNISQIKRVVDFIVDILSDNEVIKRSLKIRSTKISSKSISGLEELEFENRTTIRDDEGNITKEGLCIDNFIDQAYLLEIGNTHRDNGIDLPKLYYKIYYVPDVELKDVWKAAQFSSLNINGSTSTFVSYFINDTIKNDNKLFVSLITSVIKHYINFILYNYGLTNCLNNNEEFLFEYYYLINNNIVDKMNMACLIFKVYFKLYSALLELIAIGSNDNFYNVLPPNSYSLIPSDTELQENFIADYDNGEYKGVEYRYEPIYDYAMYRDRGKGEYSNSKDIIKWIYNDILL